MLRVVFDTNKIGISAKLNLKLKFKMGCRSNKVLRKFGHDDGVGGGEKYCCVVCVMHVM